MFHNTEAIAMIAKISASVVLVNLFEAPGVFFQLSMSVDWLAVLS